ncbi:MAG: hypothetical protein ABEJ42_08535 [Halobacteriaceae archaeon]
MDEEILDAQRDLVAAVTDAGWTVTESELSVYESPWTDESAPEVTVTISARQVFPELEAPDADRDPGDRSTGGDGGRDGSDDSPFRVK